MLKETIIHNIGSSFSHIVYDHFTMPWHYHNEYELILITSGGGKRFVGDYIDDFKPGDLVLFGAKLPHYHMCYGLINNEPDKISTCEVIQFNEAILPSNIHDLEEFRMINDLLMRSHRGIKFNRPPSIERIQRMMRYIDSLNGIRRVSALFRILELLGRLTDYQLLTRNEYSLNLIGDDDNDPVNRVYKYLHENFKNDISLDQLASKLGFNTSALCRHYKRRVQKSIFESLQEIRIGFACKLLLTSSLSVSQVCFEVGYKNISNFNRQFKNSLNMTPTEYKTMSRVSSLVVL